MPLFFDNSALSNLTSSRGERISNATLPDVYSARLELVDCTIEAGTKIPNSTVIRGNKTKFLGPCDFGDGVVFDDVANIGDNHKFGSWCSFNSKHSSPVKIGNNNAFGYGTQLPALTTIGDSNNFGSGTEIGNFAQIGNNNIFGRNSIVSLEEIAAIGNNNKFLTGSVAGINSVFEENKNVLIPPPEGKTYEGQVFENKEVFSSGSRFINCRFNEKCRFGSWSVFEGHETTFAEGCEFGERTTFHISSMGNGHTIGSWSDIRHLNGNPQAGIPYGTTIGDKNRIGYGVKVAHGVKIGNTNFIDSGAQVGNFTQFGTGNRIGRFSQIGKETELGVGNVFYPGCSVNSFVKMGRGNIFDKTVPPYQMWNGAVDQGVRRNIPRIRDRVAGVLR